ncbi:uncharacterized protein LOC105388770 [Plutella xylostella]|uniref:uncharacterized protein LOC105388770 n=1 Tax=Plutella xylostella TaxID=51655 RepID=UPI0020323891|nr:uncharacterized protein LOC105388770 [Plutella xylostella]
MTHSCSQCDFTAEFASSLTMHHQLHHDAPCRDDDDVCAKKTPLLVQDKSRTLPCRGFDDHKEEIQKDKKLSLGRTNSATRMFDRIRAKICRSKPSLLPHPEEESNKNKGFGLKQDLTPSLPVSKPCTSQYFNVDTQVDCSEPNPCGETFACHLCDFVADRITVLDRHLLNDHKIGLDNLLQLVMAKTKDGLTEQKVLRTNEFHIQQPYYKAVDEIIEDGEFVVETVQPKVKILRHVATNTEMTLKDFQKANCDSLDKNLGRMMELKASNGEDEDFVEKMKNLNDCMSKFIYSSNSLKRALESKSNIHENQSCEAAMLYDLGMGDETPRDWEKMLSDKTDRRRSLHHQQHFRNTKSKLGSDSFYYS